MTRTFNDYTRHTDINEHIELGENFFSPFNSRQMIHCLYVFIRVRTGIVTPPEVTQLIAITQWQ